MIDDNTNTNDNDDDVKRAEMIALNALGTSSFSSEFVDMRSIVSDKVSSPSSI
jgi:hypothetical protein